MNEVEFGQVKEAVTTLKEEFKGLREDVSEIKDMLAQSKGGFRVLLWLGGLVAGVVGAIGGLLSRLIHPSV